VGVLLSIEPAPVCCTSRTARWIQQDISISLPFYFYVIRIYRAAYYAAYGYGLPDGGGLTSWRALLTRACATAFMHTTGKRQEGRGQDASYHVRVSHPLSICGACRAQ